MGPDVSAPLIFPQLGPIYQSLAPVADTLIRVVVGLALMPHACRFCFGWFPETGSRILSIDLMVGALTRSGYRPPRLWAYVIAVTELAGGPLIALGLFTRPVALVVFIFLINAVIEHARFDGYFWNKLGLEYPMIWSAAMLFFVVHGGGHYSLDYWLLRHEF